MRENCFPAESEEIEINVLSLLKELIRKWYIIAATALVCAALLIANTFIHADRRYTSSASAYLLSKTDRTTAITTAELSASATLAADFAQIVQSMDVAREIVSRLNLSESIDALKSAISTSYTSGNRIVTIRVKNKEAELAQKIGETLLTVAEEKASSISKTLYIEVVDRPNMPSSISKPEMKSPLIKGFLLGFVFACACIIIKWFIRKPIWDETDAEDYLKVPSLGSLSSIEP